MWPIVITLAIVLLLAPRDAHSAESPPPPPPGVSISFPPFSNRTLLCQYDKSVNLPETAICTSSVPPGQIIFSNDDDVISVRYQYRTPVALWKKGSPYAASFSTQFTLQFHRDAERSEKRVFGGGIAFAITPSIDVGSSGPESFGLFSIDDSTGKAAGGKDTKTVAVEIDTSRDVTYSWDPPIPHVGVDVNSVNSVASRYLWDGPSFIDRKIAVFIDYDASRHRMEVRFQNVTSNGKPNKSKSQLWLSYDGLDLAATVNELSYVGFSSRVPVTTDGVYFLYDWKFSTNWVLVKGAKH
ncbi:hypothetical protein KP509_21G020600 [Ceratopteris richardii]|uniref:Legume lectin domain-containing protein n=1 Tax=Ceratopteris richardii TaxID=49495 RepID=A0A8T2S7Z2_CERRI|nr:hypothetical protein KP509_21G020600 [Ceratopteris richardii]